MDISCIIVDDERLLRESLAGFITKYCPGLSIVGKAASAAEARQLLEETRVDVIFCDIQMPGETGFDLLQSIDVSNYHIVFVTAYNEYALQAIKARAFDYLLKPVDIHELKETVAALTASVEEKRKSKERGAEYKTALMQLFGDMQSVEPAPGKIAVHHATGISFIELDDILFLEGDGCYTVVHLADNKKIMATRILSEFEEFLPESKFFRVHKSTIVNLRFVSEFSRTDGFFVILKNGISLSVGRRRVQAVLDRFMNLAKSM